MRLVLSECVFLVMRRVGLDGLDGPGSGGPWYWSGLFGLD